MLIAFTLRVMLEDLGHDVVDVAGRFDDAMEPVRSKDFAIAVLDLRLGDEMTFPVADLLVEMDKRLIFSTG